MVERIVNFIRKRFREEGNLVTSALLLFLIGLVIQIVVIICSFSWSEEQFGLPTVSPGLFIVATVLTVCPILGFVAFFVFAGIMLSTFHGSNFLTHPWFYHLLGMAIFNVGMILLMVADSQAK